MEKSNGEKFKSKKLRILEALLSKSIMEKISLYKD